MTDAPERIWAATYHEKKEAGYWHSENDVWNGVEYVRADLVAVERDRILAILSRVTTRVLPKYPGKAVLK